MLKLKILNKQFFFFCFNREKYMVLVKWIVKPSLFLLYSKSLLMSFFKGWGGGARHKSGFPVLFPTEFQSN